MQKKTTVGWRSVCGERGGVQNAGESVGFRAARAFLKDTEVGAPKWGLHDIQVAGSSESNPRNRGGGGDFSEDSFENCTFWERTDKQWRGEGSGTLPPWKIEGVARLSRFASQQLRIPGHGKVYGELFGWLGLKSGPKFPEEMWPLVLNLFV